MTTEQFSPELSWREANLAKDQLWQDSDGKISAGPILAKRLWSLGIINNVQQFLEIPVGGAIKTGMSAYQRIQ